jgi:bifunctional DNase/RNase
MSNAEIEPDEDDATPKPTPTLAPEPIPILAPDLPVTFKVMNVESVLYDLADAAPLVHLMEAESPYRYVAIPVALPEAVALSNALSGTEGRRPSSHELFSEVLARLRADVVAARIVRYDGGVFYTELDVMTPRGREVFDCRTSDALILAIRQKVQAPVLCDEEVLVALYTESN